MTHSPESAPERRQRRSEDPITALHYQLAHARREGALDAVVLVDAQGALVAGAGAWPLCEELAALAPLLVRRDAIAHEETRIATDDLADSVEVRALSIDGAEVLLAARGIDGSGAKASMVRAAVGCRRILGAAA